MLINICVAVVCHCSTVKSGESTIHADVMLHCGTVIMCGRASSKTSVEAVVQGTSRGMTIVWIVRKC